MSLKVSIICLTVVLPQRQIQLSVHVPILLYFFVPNKCSYYAYCPYLKLTSDFLIHFNIPMIILSDCLSVAHVRRRSCLLLPLWCTWLPLSLKQVCNELVDLYLWLDLIIILPWHCDINWKKRKGKLLPISSKREINSIKM